MSDMTVSLMANDKQVFRCRAWRCRVMIDDDVCSRDSAGSCPYRQWRCRVMIDDDVWPEGVLESVAATCYRSGIPSCTIVAVIETQTPANYNPGNPTDESMILARGVRVSMATTNHFPAASCALIGFVPLITDWLF